MSKTSKWFVVATEGATTDGRTINRSWIEQMAEQYDPKNTYAARINLDHLKTWFYRENEPHAQAYGDVLAVKAQEREDGKLQLLQAVQAPFVPKGTILITRLDNLSIYYQEGAMRRTIKDKAERDRIEDYTSSNDDFVVENYEMVALIKNITMVD